MATKEFPPRQVTLLLCDTAGHLMGALPPFEVEVPWWQEVAGVVTGARERFGVEVIVLRLLEAGTGWGTAGGAVTYLAEGAAVPEAGLVAWSGDDPLDDHPLRLPYARPGGPAADLAWADAALAAAGCPRTGPAEQMRTWNLSSIWRLPTSDGPTWLKVVPPFFAHEGAMLGRLHPAVVPPLVATEGPRVLLADVPGDDHWGAELPVLRRLVTMLVGLQASWSSRIEELQELGTPDWRAPTFVPAAERLLELIEPELDDETTSRLGVIVAGLPDRFGAVADCGLPDSLVHGDFHPGNSRGGADEDGRSVLLDWGDCGIGHPLLDQAASMASIRPEQRDELRAYWSALWRSAVPGSDPDRAAELLEPVAALQRALVYRSFLDAVEPAEHIYHSGDPAQWLRRAAGQP